MVPQAPVDALLARHDAEGLHIHARTAMPGWLGERLDVGYAIDVLHPLAACVRTAVEFDGPSAADRAGARRVATSIPPRI